MNSDMSMRPRSSYRPGTPAPRQLVLQTPVGKEQKEPFADSEGQAARARRIAFETVVTASLANDGASMLLHAQQLLLLAFAHLRPGIRSI